MDKIRNLVKDAAQRFPHFRLIGWDIAIDENNEKLIYFTMKKYFPHIYNNIDTREEYYQIVLIRKSLQYLLRYFMYADLFKYIITPKKLQPCTPMMHGVAFCFRTLADMF